MSTSNVELHLASFRAYNDWLADFCADAPEEFIGLGYIPMADVTHAVDELKHVAKKGLRGAGIPAEDLPHIFGRLYRVDPSRARTTGGAGLGLTISKKLIEAHGGRIWAESVIGQGSRFIIELPLTAPTETESEDRP